MTSEEICLCKCGHRVERHEQARLSLQPCYEFDCKCSDYTYDRSVEPQ